MVKVIKEKKIKSVAAKVSTQRNILFDSTELVKRLLATASERGREVLVCRFGLGASPERETLEAIGSRSGITRERVRQIEAVALDVVRNSKVFQEARPAFEELVRHVIALGTLVPEDALFSTLGSDEKSRNRLRFLLTLDSAFVRERETDEFLARWHVDSATSRNIHNALSKLYALLPDDKVVAECELVNLFLEELKSVNDAYKNDEILKRWLSLSKNIDSNPLAEWGRTSVPAIRVKGIRDYAYLAIKQGGKPMHFSEVAKAISTMFSKKAHIATTHNELIKDPRFVLVGRGLYSLTEWGYKPGVVRDVIREVLKKEGPLKKEEIIKQVKRARFVKDNTILVNLNDSRYFIRTRDGRYTVT